MPLQIRFEGEVAILGNVRGLMNDPRYVDATRDVDELIDRGFRAFVVEMRGINETSAPLLGLLLTLTRLIRRRGGEIVLAGVRKGLAKYLDEMQMEDYWDTFEGLDDAKSSFSRRLADEPPS